jgi:hypothetical protein
MTLWANRLFAPFQRATLQLRNHHKPPGDADPLHEPLLAPPPILPNSLTPPRELPIAVNEHGSLNDLAMDRPSTTVDSR